MGILSGKLGKAALGRFALGRRLIQNHARLSQEAIEVLYSRTANIRLSQDSLETLRGANPHARSSQEVVEILRGKNTITNAGLSQEVVEVLRQHTVGARASQEAIEILRKHTIITRLSQAPIEILREREVFRTGPGNGGETFPIQLAPVGIIETAILSGDLSSTDGTAFLAGDSGLPSTGGFIVIVDNEVIYLSKIGIGTYRIFHRGLSNTLPASHTAGTSVTWTDTYDMAIKSEVDISFLYTDTSYFGGGTYSGWLIGFDSTQAYLSGSRYTTRVSELVGVFAAGAGTTTNKTDGSQPSAEGTPLGVSEDCPVGITVPARMSTDIFAGDVAIVRYTNPESSILTISARSAGIQSWYGMLRVNNSNVDVTLTDPNGNIVDGSISDEFYDDPFVTVTLPGSSRTFTYGSPHYSDKGWPIGVIAVRQENRRVPLWTSPDWHNFSYVYNGFGVDRTFAQILINRNSVIYSTEPTIALPGPEDINGPNATLDDASYHVSSAWYVALLSAPVIFIGPVIGGPPPGESPPPPPPTIVPIILPGGSGGGGPGSIPPAPGTEGGSGGGIDLPPTPGGPRFWGTIL